MDYKAIPKFRLPEVKRNAHMRINVHSGYLKGELGFAGLVFQEVSSGESEIKKG